MTDRELSQLEKLWRKFADEMRSRADDIGAHPHVGLLSTHPLDPSRYGVFVEFVGNGVMAVEVETLANLPERLSATWKAGIAQERKRDEERRSMRPQRTSPKAYASWAMKVKQRDGRCLMCGETEKLCAHHIRPRRTHMALRNDINNGATLCAGCHGKTIGREHLFEAQLMALVAGTVA